VLICIQHLTLFFGGHHFAAKTAMQDLMLHHIVDYAELSCGQGHGSDKGKAIGKAKTLFKAKPFVPARQS